MADLAVGLAKWVVAGTLSKARAAIAEEAELHRSAQRDLVFISDEFQMMQSFLEMANVERIENKVVMTWVRQIRELAYDVEDCIEFVIHLDNKPSWWFRMIPFCITPVLPLDVAVHVTEQLKARVVDVSTRNTHYSLISDTGSRPAVVQQQQWAVAGTAALSMLVSTGTRQQRGDLTQLVVNDKIRVISVWSTGGDFGVASVIWKAYNDQEIRQKFSYRAWVKLMHPFNPQEFVGCMMDQFYANRREEKEEIIGLDLLRRGSVHGEHHHLTEFDRQLNNERYLVVLEGLSSMTDWDAISKFFPERNNGGCIIISTQQSEVASLSVGHPCQVWELNKLSQDHSVYALYKEIAHYDGDKSAWVTTDKRKAAQDWMTEHRPIGRESEMKDLLQNTFKARFGGFQVLSVWGITGVGKSTLLTCLFCDRILNDCALHEKKKNTQFNKYAWVDVSYPFNLRDFSRSLLWNFYSQYIQGHKDHDINLVESNDPTMECRDILKRGKCLVVIDGLQSVKEWDLIQAEFVSGSSENCIIIITTEPSVAKGCHGNKGKLVYNVKGLQADDARVLFKNEISSMYEIPHALPLGDVAEVRELISKCGGLPKVIVDIAKSLATQPARQMDIAHSINNNFMHVLENNREFDGLFTWMDSYFHTCPDSLKPCIFYLSIFPRDRCIRRRRLVRRWIAEGYSNDSHEESAELNGEKQFSDLLDQSIIQQSQQKATVADRRIVLCQVNGFIREYIVKRQMEENLIFELGHNCIVTTQRTGRHLVILECWDRDRILFQSIDFSRLRSLTVFGQWKPFFIPQSMKLLRVLDLEDASCGFVYQDLKKMVKLLHRLKFLSLRGRHEINRLPKSLDNLRQLQTLDVRHTSIVTLPESITKLQKLQYIRAGTIDDLALAPPPRTSSCWFCRRHPIVGVVMPRGIGKLTALHTLGVVNVAASGSKTFVKDLKKLTQLRKLGVSGINRKNSEKFFSAISGHLHLESLSVQFDKDTQGCSFKNGLEAIESLEKLRSLKLYGIDYKLPEWGRNKFSKLEKLYLEKATLMEQEIKFLGELPQLCILRVKQLQDGELQFHVIVNGEEEYSFQKVKVLQISFGSSSSTWHVKFGEETMKNLELLKVDCYGGSPPYQFSGLENLEELKQVLLLNSSNAQALKEQLESQLAEHPNKPVVKLEEHLCLS